MRAFAAAGLLALLAVPGGAAVSIDLSGPWRFRVDAEGSGFGNGWARAVPDGAEVVDVPHTWGRRGPHQEHEGLAWYWRTLPPAAGHRTELRLGAVFYRARVFLNGHLAGEHEGGHTAWTVDLTPHLKGGDDLVAVEVDNRPGMATIPGWGQKGWGWYDWWHDGGIVRAPLLVVHGASSIRRQRTRARLATGNGTVTSRVVVESYTGVPAPLRLEARVMPPAGGPPITSTVSVPLDGPGQAEVNVRVAVPDPERWHVDRPRVYRLALDLRDAAGRLLDSREESIGFRTVEIRERALYLNGERVRLSGMTRHQDSPWEGLAETRGTIRHDWDDLKNLQTTLTRPVHYPQAPEVFDYADREGVLLVPEIPMWQFSEEQMKDPKVIALAKALLQEMIEEHGHHPSVFAWSVCNESATATPGGVAYVRAMKEWIRSLDPDRFVTYADDGLSRPHDPGKSAARDADFIMMNQYFGSWHGAAEELRAGLERVGRGFPDKMVLISEFGYAGLFEGDSAAADRKRVQIIEEQLAEFGRHPWIGGAIFWCYQDYRSHRNLWPEETEGFVEMGVVDENRQRRPSYDVWRKANAPARVELRWTQEGSSRPRGFRATVTRRRPDEIPSYELRGYRLAWRAIDRDRKVIGSGESALPDIGAPAVVEGTWTAPATPEIVLEAWLKRPTGFTAAQAALRWFEPQYGGMPMDEMKTKGLILPTPAPKP